MSSLFSHSASSANFSWTGATSNDWLTLGNWSSGVPSNNNDYVTINLLGSFSGTVLGGASSTVIGGLKVGDINGSDGQLTIKSGAELTMAGSWVNSINLIVGSQVGSRGMLNVNGIIHTNEVTLIGDKGTGVLKITDGGKFYNDNRELLIGYNNNGDTAIPSGSSGYVLVQGPGSLLLVNSGTVGLRVGQAGNGTLDIQNGGYVKANNVGIAHNTANSIGTVLVAGDNSKLESSSYIYVGSQGTGSLSVSDKGVVSASNGMMIIGDKATSRGQVSIMSGGQLSAQRLFLANTGASSQGSLSVSGVDSKVVISQDISLGQNGKGTMVVSDQAQVNSNSMIVGNAATSVGNLSVLDGGKVSTSGTTGVTIASVAGSSGNVSVLGDGSSLISSAIVIGNGGNGTVSLGDSATMTASSSIKVGNNSGSIGELYLFDGATLNGSMTIASLGGSRGAVFVGRDHQGTRSTNPGTINGTVSFGTAGIGSINFDHEATDYEFSNLFTGGGSNSKIIQSFGTTQITANSTAYLGSVDIVGGTLSLGNGGSSGYIKSTSYNVGESGTLAFNRVDNYQFYSEIKGNGHILVSSGGVVNLVKNSSTFSGLTTIQDGVLSLGSGGTLGELGGDFKIESQGSLAFNRQNTLVINGTIEGTGFLQQISGTTSLMADNSNFTGTSDVFGGVLQIGDGSEAGNHADIRGQIRTISVLPGVFAINRTNDYSFGAELTGSGLVKHLGTGTTTLTADNTSFTGTFTVDKGTVVADSSQALGGTSASYVVNQAGTLSLNGYHSRLGNVTNQGILDMSVMPSTAGTALNLSGSFTQTSTGILNISISSAPDIIANNVTLNGVVNISGFSSSSTVPQKASLLPGTYELIRSANEIQGQFNTVNPDEDFAVSTVDFLTSGRARLSEDKKSLLLTGLELAWTQGGKAYGVGDFTLATGTAFEVDVVLKDQTLPTGGFLSGWNGRQLVKRGEGTLYLTANNEYTGGTEILGGVLSINSANSLGAASSNVTLGAGVLHVSTTLADSHAISLTHANSAIDTDNGVTATWSGAISGMGGLDKRGEGSLVLTHGLSYSGDTVITNGELELQSSTSALLGDIINNSHLIFNQNDDSSVRGDISYLDPQQAGSVQTIKKNSNTLTLLGNSSVDWEIQAGELRVSSEAFLGDVVMADDTILSFDQPNTEIDSVYEGMITGTTSSTINKDGAGRFSIAYQPNSIIGSVHVNEGTLMVNARGASVPEAFHVTGDFITGTGANTEIAGQNTYLRVDGGFAQAAGSTLSVALDLTNSQADITAHDMSLNGVLLVTGFAGQRGAQIAKASEIDRVFYTLLSSVNDITGNFENDPSIDSGLDYLLYRASLSSDKKSYLIDDLQLAWFEGKADRGTGNFTINQGTAFEVDTELSTQPTTFSSSYLSGWDGNSLVKLGDGLLVLSAQASYTGSTTVSAGTLALTANNAIASSHEVVINQGILELNGVAQTLNALSGTGGEIRWGEDSPDTVLTVNNQSSSDDSSYQGDIIGSGELIKEGEGKLTLLGKTLWTGGTQLKQGALILDGSDGKAQLTSDIQGMSDARFLLNNGATFTGSMDGGQMSIDQTSYWSMTASSVVNDLTVAGRLSFLPPAQEDGPYKTLTVEGNYVGEGGLIEFSGHLLGDDSPIDRLIVTGDTSGNTQVSVNNLGGAGALTTHGIELITVQGQSNGVFEQSGRIVAGAYDYVLGRGKGVNTNNWYLSIMTSEPGPGPGPGPGEEENPGPIPPGPEPEGARRPEVGSYLANALAVRQLFDLRWDDHKDHTGYGLSADPSARHYAWVRTQGDRVEHTDDSQQLGTRSHRTLLQVGGDVAEWTHGDARTVLGVFAGYGTDRSRTNSSVSKYSAWGKVDGYQVGVYGSWLANTSMTEGPYVDSWLYYAKLKNTVDGEGQVRERYDSEGINASLEAGYTIMLDQNNERQYFIEPQAQVIWSGIGTNGHHEANGTNIEVLGDHGLQTRLGAKFGMTLSQPLSASVHASWIYNDDPTQVRLDDMSTRVSGDRNLGELRLDLKRDFSKRLNMSLNTAYRRGEHGYEQMSIRLDARARF